MLSQLTPEERLCCLLGLGRLSGQQLRQATRIAEPGVDWERFADLTGHHRVFPQVNRHFSENRTIPIPEQPRARMRAYAIANAKRSSAMAIETAALIDALKEAGVPAVPFKGPVLIEKVWGDCELGVYQDLDFLVRPSHTDRAAQVLCGRGFRSAKGRSEGALLLGRQHPLGFQVVVDLQCRVLPAWMDPRDRAGRLWDHVRPGKYRDCETLFLRDEWELMLVTLHSLKHRFQDLYHLTILHDLLEKNSRVWPQAVDCARTLGLHHELQYSRRACLAVFQSGPGNAGNRSDLSLLVERPFRSDTPTYFWLRIQLASRRSILGKSLCLLKILVRSD